jgi:transposase
MGKSNGKALDASRPESVAAERRAGEPSEPIPTVAADVGDMQGVEGARLSPPDPEVPAKAARRSFNAEYKQRILRAADACREEGAIGALLRREGLYSSHLATWRRQRAQAVQEALAPHLRGRPATPHPLEEENQKLRRENARLAQRLQQAEIIIEIQKKVSALLGIPLQDSANGEKDS